MTLHEQIRADWINARKQRNEVHANVLGLLIGTIQTKEKNFSSERSLTDGEIVQEVKKLLDGVIESKKLLKEGSNLDKLSQEETILSSYMPTQMSESELATFIKAKADEGNDFKNIMSALRAEHLGKYDGKTASELVKKALAK
jgi:uncharacterized protein YqeY